MWTEVRVAFNDEAAEAIAMKIGISKRYDQGASTRFAYFHNDDRLLLVAGDHLGSDVQFAARVRNH